METETKTWSEFPDGGKAITEQILATEEITKSQTAGLSESQSGIRVGKVTIWIRSFEIENYNRIHQAYHFHQNTLTSLHDGR